MPVGLISILCLQPETRQSEVASLPHSLVLVVVAGRDLLTIGFWALALFYVDRGHLHSGSCATDYPNDLGRLLGA